MGKSWLWYSSFRCRAMVAIKCSRGSSLVKAPSEFVSLYLILVFALLDERLLMPANFKIRLAKLEDRPILVELMAALQEVERKLHVNRT